MKKLLLLLAVLTIGACDTSTPTPPTNTPDSNPGISAQPGSPAATFNLNGSWHYAANGGIKAGCLTIANLSITVLDDGCNGNTLQLVNHAQAYTYGSHAEVYCSYNVTPGDTSSYGLWDYSLESQPDGTLAGTATVRLEPTGQILTGNVVWVRQ